MALKENLDVLKSGFDVLKQVLIGIILGFLIFSPASIGGALDKIGIAEGDFWGLKWKKEFKAAEKDLKKTDDALQQSQADKDQLAGQLKLANETITKQNDLIATLQRGAPAAAPAAEVARTVDAGKALIDENRKTISESQRNLQTAQQVIITNSQRFPAPSRWLVIAGSDGTQAEASNEVRRARNAGFADVKIFKNRGVFRTAIVYSNREDAADALPDVKSKVRDSAYIVSLDKWCTNASPPQGDLIDCGS